MPTTSTMLTSYRQQISRPGSGFRSQWGWDSLNRFNDLTENSRGYISVWCLRGWLWLNAPLSSTTEQGCYRSGLIREEQPGPRVCRGCVHLSLLLLLKVVQIPAVRYCSLTLHPVSFNVASHKMCLRTPCHSWCTSIPVFELCWFPLILLAWILHLKLKFKVVHFFLLRISASRHDMLG